MSSNRRLAILWNAVTGATGSGIRIVLISSSGRLTRLPVAGEVVGQRHLALAVASRPAPARRPAPAAPAGCRRSASRCRGCRRGWRRCGSAGTRTAGTARPAAAPGRPGRARSRTGSAPRRCRCWSAPTSSARSSASRSMPMVSAARACRMFSSTPQSVDPATSRASGCSASRSSASARSAGRTKSPWPLVIRVGGRGRRGLGRAGRTAGRRRPGCAERVGGVPDRPVAGAAAQVAAQRVQVEAVRPVLVVGACPARALAVGRARRLPGRSGSASAAPVRPVPAPAGSTPRPSSR